LSVIYLANSRSVKMECLLQLDVSSQSKLVEFKFEALGLKLALGPTNRLLDTQLSSDSSSSQDSACDATNYMIEWSFRNTIAVSALAEAGPNSTVNWPEPLQLRVGLYFQATKNGRMKSNQVSKLSVKMRMNSGNFKVIGSATIDFASIRLDNRDGSKFDLAVGSMLHPDARLSFSLVPTSLIQDPVGRNGTSKLSDLTLTTMN
jgi:hypothetical protein